ncbi:MAG: hypothetical protein HYY68_05165 [Thaumarchaeota archaeon]|nr:hypothetical protein [Nitrososphaerota archaeon]
MHCILFYDVVDDFIAKRAPYRNRTPSGDKDGTMGLTAAHQQLIAGLVKLDTFSVLDVVSKS